MSTQQDRYRPAMDPDPTRQASPVVVGVDGSTHNERAVEWAAVEAERTHRELRLVTTTGVFTEPEPHRTLGFITSYDYGAQYTEMLAKVAADLRGRHPGLQVFPWVHAGDPVTALVDMSRERGALVVVGKRGRGAVARLLIGSTSIAVAGRAAGPVVVVPDEWVAPAGAASPIVVGVDFDHENDALLGFAVERAAALRVGVIAVHAWRTHQFPSLSDEERARWMTDMKRRLEEELVSWRERYPDVVIRSEQVEDDAAHALLDAGRLGQLVVIGRKGLEHPVTGLPFGAVARAVLHDSHIPVAVVPSR
jgi:nucleotide-binding universal stress UspA family protein